MFSVLSISQVNRCSTDEYRQVLKSKGLYNNHQNVNKAEYVYPYSNNYDIPVVIHILYNNEDQNISDDRIFSQIETLNNDYNALNIEIDDIPDEFQNVIGTVGFNFCLVQEDLNGNSFTGINRVYTTIESFQGFSDDMKKSEEGGVDAWDTENYLNIWVCDLNGNTLGFSTMPGDDADIDGVVIDYEYFGVDLSSSNPYNLGRTGTHELGHYFNLEHTFLSGCASWGGDGCDDTPQLQSPTYGCPSYPQESCSSNNMTMNYMDYTNDACMYMFTVCQAERMIDALLTYRSNLIASTNCSVSIDEDIQSNYINIYPNPVADVLYIDSHNIPISIFDIYGRRLIDKYIINDRALNVSFLSTGTYFLSIREKTYKIIKR
tara:strand:+ start:263 stop:1390 length:1128 start_codon:yes stop_codon:yes gene_type:complete